MREAMQFDPELATKLSQFFVGGLYQREVITKRERQLCVIGADGPSLRGRAARAYPCGSFRGGTAAPGARPGIAFRLQWSYRLAREAASSLSLAFGGAGADP